MNPPALFSRRFFPALLLLVPALVMIPSGCDVVPPAQLDQTRFYVLTGPEPAPAEGGTLRVGLCAVRLPAYLKSPLMIVRRGANEVAPQDYARWAEPLDAGIARVLRAQLRATPGVGQLYQQPFPLDRDRDYDLMIEIIRCEGSTANGRPVAQFTAAYEISTAGNDPHVVARKTFVAREIAWDGRDFGRLAADLSQDVASFGREAAAALPVGVPTR
jgi:uncharacterized protein